MGTTKSQRTILSEDGELRPIDTETDAKPDGEAISPEARLSAVFCCNCGTANQANSRFCRACGQSLDEQVINAANLDSYAPPEWKNKRLADRAAKTENAKSQDAEATLEGITLFFLGVFGAIALATQQAWMTLIAIVLMFAIIIVSRWRASRDQ